MTRLTRVLTSLAMKVMAVVNRQNIEAVPERNGFGIERQGSRLMRPALSDGTFPQCIATLGFGTPQVEVSTAHRSSITASLSEVRSRRLSHRIGFDGTTTLQSHHQACQIQFKSMFLYGDKLAICCDLLFP